MGKSCARLPINSQLTRRRQAYATREDFAQQRSMLTSIDSRMGNVVSSMPGINKLISMIGTRRRRDTFIVGGTVCVCVLILLWYVFGI